MSFEIEKVECQRCGIKGIHACLGVKQKAMTPEHRSAFDAKLAEAIKIVKEIRKND